MFKVIKKFSKDVGNFWDYLPCYECYVKLEHVETKVITIRRISAAEVSAYDVGDLIE